MQKLQLTPSPNKNLHKLLAQYGAERTTTDYQKNQTIFVQGQVADTVFFIQKGRVKVTVMSEHGKEAVVAILNEGQFFGEGCLNDQPRRMSSTSAMTDCQITSITKSAMLTAIHDQPKFSTLFMDHLLSRNSRIQADVVDQLFNSSEKRLARLLLLLANYGKEGSPPHRISYRKSGDACGNDRHHAIPGQPFHEQIPQIRLHRLQRKDRSPPIVVELSPER
jgi:CRP-like cAMP-binding protein